MSQRSPRISEWVFGGRDDVFAPMPAPPPPSPATLIPATARSTRPCAMSRSSLMPTCSAHGPDCNHTAGMRLRSTRVKSSERPRVELMKRARLRQVLTAPLQQACPLSCSPFYRNPAAPTLGEYQPKDMEQTRKHMWTCKTADCTRSAPDVIDART